LTREQSQLFLQGRDRKATGCTHRYISSEDTARKLRLGDYLGGHAPDD